MTIDSCLHCGNIFRPSSAGIQRTLCPKCFLDCEAAFEKIQMIFLKRKPASYEDLVSQAGLPKIFANLIERERRYEAFMKNFCRHCHITLVYKDRDRCDKCFSKVNHIIDWKRKSTESAT